MATQPSRIRTIEEATSRTWSDWVAFLDEAGARELEHKAIAELVHQKLSHEIESSGWWAQSITVAFEQEIGRRQPGQSNDGTYETTVTKTLLGTKDDVYSLWLEKYNSKTDFLENAVSNVRTSTTPIRSYWRCDLSDGTKVTFAVEQRTSSHAMIAVTHTKLASNKAKDTWQSYWKEQLEKL